MNVLVIPSWYPSAASPAAGGFVRDQALALAQHRPDWRIAVGLWGHHDGALSLRSPGASLRALRWRARGRASRWLSQGPVHEVLTPALSWTLAMAGGGAAGLLRATRRNLEMVRARFGTVHLMHAHVGFPAGWIAAQLGAEAGIPFVLTEHMSPFPFPALRTAKGALKPDLRAAYDAAAATIAVSPSLAAQIRAEGLRCSHVIPNLVDERRFAPPRARQPGGPRIVFTLGAMTAQKGIDVLLRAFARWNPAPGTVQLRIGGAGPQAQEYRQLAAALGVADRVRWLGPLAPAHVPEQFAACDLFVLASRHETFGVVLAEALVSGKPVVATRCGGPESIVDAGNGLLVEVGDEVALAAAMQSVLDDPQRFDAAAIRESALRRYARGAVAAQLAAVYEEVVIR
ncbi:MAG TPA: glycosyltransferase [Burkholderiaceae bacterium]|nr:glycosyltransferase [Burkholderiaceae bacterium]